MSLKKIVLFVGVLTLGVNTGFSQVVEQGNVIITPYYGGPNFGKLFAKIVAKKLDEFSVDSGLGPAGIRGEYMVHERVGVGFDFIYSDVSGSGYIDSTLTNGVLQRYNLDATSKRFRFLLKANFHIYTTDNFDFYTGLGLGANIRSLKVTTDIPYLNEKSFTGLNNPIAGRFALGFTYYPVHFFGLNMELGIGGPVASAGLTFKI